ncbi:hypothetical protein [Campylobacter sp. P091]|uniref:hypothetical protein n=1 Tax=Campylobacter sp. P091 TaxID=1895621 RepID=UPI000A3487E4|nr:hypothetical protein [Campylobacter sp. P091]
MRKINFDILFNEMACTKNVSYISNYHAQWCWDVVLKHNGTIDVIIDDFLLYNRLKTESNNKSIKLSYQTLSKKPELKLSNCDGLGISPRFYNRFKDTLPTTLSLNSWIMLIKNKKNIFWLDLHINFDNYHILKEFIDNKELFEQIPYITLYIDQLLLETMELTQINSILKNIYISN